MSTSEQVNFVYRHQPKKTSKHGILLTYLKEDEAEFSLKERMLNPLVAFWLPFAYQQCTNVSEQELQQLARSSIYQLKLHIQYLEDSFGLNESQILMNQQANPNQMKSNGFVNNGSSNGLPNREYLEEPEEDFSDEDDILSQLI